MSEGNNRQETRSPLVRDAVDARLLSGLSGAEIWLLTRDGRHWFVRKAARDPGRSERLRRQADKQRRFEGLMNGLVRTPRIIGEGEVDGRYTFDMEFIRGTDAATYLRGASLDEVRRLGDRLASYVEAAAACPPLTGIDAPATQSRTLFEATYSKVCEVQRKTRLADQVLARLLLSLDRLRRLDHLSPTLCHGDLTLENIVVAEGGDLYLLDFLDPPYEHYFQDVAKLHQDLAGGWYLLREPSIAQCVLDHLSRKLVTVTTRLDPTYAEVHPVLLALTFVRILPYTRGDEEVRFIEKRIEHFSRMLTT